MRAWALPILPAPISPSRSGRAWVMAEPCSVAAGPPPAIRATFWPGFESIHDQASRAFCGAGFLAGYSADVSSLGLFRVQDTSGNCAARFGGSGVGARGDQRGGEDLLRQRRRALARPAAELHGRLLPVQARLREEQQLEGARQPRPVLDEARAR